MAVVAVAVVVAWWWHGGGGSGGMAVGSSVPVVMPRHAWTPPSSAQSW